MSTCNSDLISGHNSHQLQNMVGMYSATQVERKLTLKINLDVFSQDLVYSVDIFNGFDAVGAGFYVYEGVDEGCGGEEADG